MTNRTGSGTRAAAKYFNTSSTLADSEAAGEDSTAIGPMAVASGAGAIATGRNAQASADGSVAIGMDASAKDGKAVSIGFGNIASGDGAVAIGDPNYATGDGAVALGKDNEADGIGALALGNTNSAVGDGASAIGNRNISQGRGAVSIGDANFAHGAGAVVLGAENKAFGDTSLAIGAQNEVSGDGAMAIGSGIWISASDTLAVGQSASVMANDAIAIGNRASASGVSSTAVGNDTLAAKAESSAFGDKAKATGGRSTAVGSSAISSGIYSVAVGESSRSSGFGSTALGLISDASAYASTALGSGAIASHDGSVALGSASGTTRGAVSDYTAFGMADRQTSLGEIAIARNIVYTDPDTGLLTPIGYRQISGVAAGSEMNDAVNVSRLKAVAQNFGNAFATSIGGGTTYDAATGQIALHGFTFNGVSYGSINAAFAAIAGQSHAPVGSNPSNNLGQAPVYDDGDHGSMTLGGATATQIRNVADGRLAPGSQDAINGGQLADTNARVNSLENGGAGVVQYSNASTPTTPNGGTRTNNVTLVGADQAPVALHNVAAGRVEDGSTDAVNGGQLAATNRAVQGAQDTANQALSYQSRAIRYDDDSNTSVTLGGNGAGSVALRNVAEGVSGTDAVNVSQLNSGISTAVEKANAYTDSRIAGLTFDLRRVGRQADAGSAAALAAAGMPQAYEAGKAMLAVGTGTYGGQSAVSVGFSKATDDGRFVLKAGATYNSRGRVGANAGIGWQM